MGYDRREPNWLCDVWIWLSSEERAEPNSEAAVFKNPVHRRMCEGILKIENHGVTYEEALQRCHIATTIEEIQSDAEDKGRAA